RSPRHSISIAWLFRAAPPPLLAIRGRCPGDLGVPFASSGDRLLRCSRALRPRPCESESSARSARLAESASILRRFLGRGSWLLAKPRDHGTNLSLPCH